MNKKKLKTNVQFAIQNKGILNYKTMNLSLPEEKYLISLTAILSTINSRKVDDFLIDLEKVIFRKNIPLFSMDVMTLLYQRWLNYPKICDLLVYFSKKLSHIHLPQKAYELLIYKTHYSGQETAIMENKIFLLAQLFRKSIITPGQSVDLPKFIKSLMTIKIPSRNEEMGPRLIEKELLEKFRPLFLWSQLVLTSSNSDSKTVDLFLTKMVERHFSIVQEIDQMDSKFGEFIYALNQIIDHSYILNYSTRHLFLVSEIYAIRPDLFTDKWISKETLKSQNIFDVIFSKFKVSRLFLVRFDLLNKKEKSWLFHVLNGNSFRSAKGLPLPLTRKATNIFINLEDNLDLSIKDGVIYASLLALGVESLFAREVVNNIRNYSQTEFWVKQMSQFYSKGLKVEDLGEVMDYISHCEFREHKGINWKHKKVENLVKESNDWHAETLIKRSFRYKRNYRFEKSKIEDFQFGSEENTYVIKQLKSSFELYEEGEVLNHCVYSYESYCKKNNTQIFSLRMLNKEDEEKTLITIEVRGERIYQAKGNSNRSPKPAEWEVIKSWAEDQKLKIAC